MATKLIILHLDATTQAQFQAVTGFMSIKMADQIKNTQEYYRQLSYNIRKGDENTRQYVDGRIDSTKKYVDGSFVNIRGNQNIYDTKSFNSSPTVPNPTSDTHAANKAYVDSKTSSGSYSQSLSSNGWTKLPMV